MKKKFLMTNDRTLREIKEIAIYTNPEKLKLLLNKLTWKVLLTLGEEEMYPMEMAKKLGIHEQKIYYHIRKLAEANAIRKVREEERKGAVAKFYRTSFPAFGIELPFGGHKQKRPQINLPSDKLRQFLNPFVKDNSFDGKIVVGSPDPHGPFKTIARDGHYASYLAFFLGQYAKLPDEFAIKLDVDVKAEKEEKNNLVLVGGPGTNLLTQEINSHLPIRFNMTPSEQGFLFNGLVSLQTKNVYTSDSMGLVAKIRNPWRKESRVMVFAGNKAVGTKGCVLALAKFSEQVLDKYEDQESFAAVIQGFDLDGDGKVDSIEVLE
ncbi:MAG: helix-turn-helix domain-containing protein [Candidatus Bathyarchaeota archaeon]|nr:helix-turn-helix domain-containing protein [Candidatus Bathyarchaeota archaeon]